jgi:site-specific recombinase XerD
MTNDSLLGPWVRRFLLEHLVVERNLARNTQASYRDTLRLLLPLLARRAHRAVDRLVVDDLSTERVAQFLRELKDKRSCGAATQNQRLAAIRSLVRFISSHIPEQMAWCGRIRAIPFRKAPPAAITYLEKNEMDAVLDTPDRHTALGYRDYAVLLFLYNTGARADEVAHALIGDLDLPHVLNADPSSVLIRGKGNKTRHCPLWRRTSRELAPLVRGRDSSEHIFLNRNGRPLTRFGIHALVERYAARAAEDVPSLRKKRTSPHTIRHTTATHMLRAGADINTIRGWLGHVSLTTTNIYANVDLEMKARALSVCEVKKGARHRAWRTDRGLMDFLRAL